MTQRGEGGKTNRVLASKRQLRTAQSATGVPEGENKRKDKKILIVERNKLKTMNPHKQETQ
jgi:hypothetical protein